MIICFEGPSAIGKTTLCDALKDNFTSIPEVNLLFNRPENPIENWYYNRQIERVELCRSNTNWTILDGDPFQPLWYNWIYDKESKDYKLSDALEFYTKAINENKITFPDLYIIFNVDYNELLKRKENDSSRKRSNFKKHDSLILNQQRYFKVLKEQTHLNVVNITYNSVAQAKQDVLSAIKSITKLESLNNTETIALIAKWLKTNKPIHSLEF